MAAPNYLPPEKIHWDRDLLAKYDVQGPRYTSYPTALQFNDSFKTQQFQDYLHTLPASISPLSLYVHIPFCEDICYYCACNKIVTKQKSKAREYLDYLHKEIEFRGKLHGKNRSITQMHWGGGTPTFLNAAEITELMYALSRHFNLTDADSREYSIEIDPRTINVETLALLKGIGFNRLSFGIQDFDPFVQHAINRNQSFITVKLLVEAAKAYHFNSINFDLIYGLPYQTPNSLQETLKKVIELSPDRIATYNYAHLPDRFKAQKQIDRQTLPSAEEKLEMFSLINETLTDHGYCFIGMDHFAKPDDTLTQAQRSGSLQRNFQGYSTHLANDLIGLGVSAISHIDRCFAQNSKDIHNYYSALHADELPIERGVICTDDDTLRNSVIIQLICNLTLDFSLWNKQYQSDFTGYFAPELKQLKQFEEDSLLEVNQSGIHIFEAGRPFLRNICMVFDKYLSTSQLNSHKRTYSKTL
jgi:oxygen-independent coproporphyrinogen-3 oxidase